jgi:hypothetical protein
MTPRFSEAQAPPASFWQRGRGRQIYGERGFF